MIRKAGVTGLADRDRSNYDLPKKSPMDHIRVLSAHDIPIILILKEEQLKEMIK